MPYKFNPLSGNLDIVNPTLDSPLQFKGEINSNTDFPLIADVENGWFYTIGTDVTDNAGILYTNTGQSFLEGDEIAWNGTNWTPVGSSEKDTLQDVTDRGATTTNNITIDNGGLTDNILNLNGSTHSSVRSTATDKFQIRHNGNTLMESDNMGDTVFGGDISADNLSGTNTGDQDLSGYVPYTGAAGNVDLNNRNLVNANSIGIGISTPTAGVLEVVRSGNGVLPPTSGTTSTAVAGMGFSTENQRLYFGTNSASPYGAWLQVANQANLASKYPLYINPRGGNVSINTTDSTSALNIGGGLSALNIGSDAGASLFGGDLTAQSAVHNSGTTSIVGGRLTANALHTSGTNYQTVAFTGSTLFQAGAGTPITARLYGGAVTAQMRATGTTSVPRTITASGFILTAGHHATSVRGIIDNLNVIQLNPHSGGAGVQTIGSGSGILISELLGSGTVDNYSAIEVSNRYYTFGGTITGDYKGLELEGLNGGTINGNEYQIFMNKSCKGTTSCWQIYSEGGNNFLGDDNSKTFFGTGKDASIYYDGTDLIIDPREVGSGILDVLGVIQSDGYNSSDGTAGATGTIDLTTTTSITVKDGLITGWS